LLYFTPFEHNDRKRLGNLEYTGLKLENL